MNENKKIDKDLDLTNELKRLCNIKRVPKSSGKVTEDQMKNQDHPDNNTQDQLKFLESWKPAVTNFSIKKKKKKKKKKSKLV